MKALFITGTDTGVGKTLITGLMAAFLIEKGYRVVTQKWVQTGVKTGLGDVSVHLKLMGKRENDYRNHCQKLVPYNLKFAASPHLAAAIEKKNIRKEKIIKSSGYLMDNFDMVVIEGTGGALVPYNGVSLLIDIAGEMSLPAIVVVENKLGAINHTLLTIEALKKRKVPILGLIFNNRQSGESRKVLKDNPTIIKKLTHEKILGLMPSAKNFKELRREFIPIGKRICDLIGPLMRRC
jgi:dethiobiotin synthetase